MKNYENLSQLSMGRCEQRAYYIPENAGAVQSLNGLWNFQYFEKGYEVQCTASGSIDVPSCWQCRGYGKPASSFSRAAIFSLALCSILQAGAIWL